MHHHGEFQATKCPRRLQLLFFKACGVTLLILLVFYTVTLTDVNIHSNLDSWNFSSVLQIANSKIQAVFEQAKTPRKTILVLLWTNYFSQTDDWLPSTLDLQCPVTECEATSNRSLLDNSSAVVLHWRSIDTSDLPRCDPNHSVHCPLWVLFNKEAPPHTQKDVLQAVEGRVQWTATYRTDSDLFAPYGKVVARSTPNYSKTVLDPSKRLVCWLVSNCDTPSKRDVFVSELEDYIEVDIYGRCGNMQCPHAAAADCYRWLSKKCLFYLSLENSLCKDYTTEKLYHALSTDMIPVVMGNSSNYKHLPPRSYINAADFPSPKALAKYLVRVGKDQQLYRSYFSWKRYYEVKDWSYRWYCDLCAKLHSTELTSLEPGRDLVSWWFDQSGCTSWLNLKEWSHA